MNDYQKQRFVEQVISAMFNTISKKKIAVYGFAFKKVRGSWGSCSRACGVCAQHAWVVLCAVPPLQRMCSGACCAWPAGHRRHARDARH